MNGLSVRRCMSASTRSRSFTLEMTSLIERALGLLGLSEARVRIATPALGFAFETGDDFSTVCRSRDEFGSMVATSLAGSIRPSTWMTSSSTKTRTTSRWRRTLGLREEWLRPLPFGRALHDAAMSTNVTARQDLLRANIAASRARRASGTETTPTLVRWSRTVVGGSTLLCVRALNTVDLPTFGSPTIPIESAMDVQR